MSLAAMQPTATAHLFPGLSDELISLLRRLSPQEWNLPTVCAPWSVKDVVAHLLGGNLSRLSLGRDRLTLSQAAQPPATYAGLVDWINERNAAWVRAAEQISPPVLIDMLAMTDQQVAAFFMTLDMQASTGIGVAWAGEDRSANWFDVGREYTEKWFHQQHIREAVGALGLVARPWLFPVLELGARAMPYAYHSVEAAEGTAITLRITGAAGGEWSLVRRGQAWTLYAGAAETAATRVLLSDDTAWRWFSRGLDRAELARRITIEGDAALGAPIADVVAIMA